MRAAVVGLGKMGAALANRLLAEGLEVTVWNRTKSATEPLVAAGAVAAAELSDVWRTAAVVLSFLANDEAIKQVLLGPDGLVGTAPEGSLLIEMSTISPSASEAVGEAAAGRRLHYVRAPVSGNPAVLAAGNLTLIVSGDEASMALARPVLERVGSKLYHVGEREQARVIKLAVNSMLAANAQMMAEVVTLCEASGIDRSVLLEVLGGSATGSPFVKYKADALVARAYDATFTTAMLLKDLRLAQSLAAETSVPLPVTRLVTELAAATCDEGMGDLDFLALLPHLQAQAGRPTDVPVPWPG
jgi:3-hydroxyisobutyrate dehydrogenase-like beta-hydroxyacid dehydrogenase